MKLKNPKLMEVTDVEVVNRQPSIEERREISAFLRSYKVKAKVASVKSASRCKV